MCIDKSKARTNNKDMKKAVLSKDEQAKRTDEYGDFDDDDDYVEMVHKGTGRYDLLQGCVHIHAFQYIRY
jgi:hypothetical protein